MKFHISQDVHNAGALCCHSLICISGIAASAVLTDLALVNPTIGAKVPILIFAFGLSVLAATRLRALQNIMHECTHRNLFASKSLNYVFGHLLGALLLKSFSRYSADHFSHHRFLGDQRRDKDLIRFGLDFRHQAPSIDTPVQAALVLLQSVNLRHMAKVFTWQIWCKNDPLWASGIRLAAFPAAIIIFFMPNPEMWGIRISFVSVIFSYLLLCTWADFADHWIRPNTGDANDSIELSRNHLFRKDFLNVIFQPRNDGYHLVHHMFPSAPTSELPRIHQSLLTSNVDYALRPHYFGSTQKDWVLVNPQGQSK